MTKFYAAESQTLETPDVSEPFAVAPYRASGWFRVVWLTLTCVLFAASGLIRVWQDSRFDVAKNKVLVSPFALKSLPQKVGSWRVIEGKEAELDPEISRVAGSTDSLVRSYVDDKTGVVVTALLIFGRAEGITAHKPEVCYPSTGYELADGDIIDMSIRTNPQYPAVFRSLIYAKRGGIAIDREEVFYAFRHEGRWSPSMDGNWRVLLYSPGVYKLQVQRRVAEREQRNLNNPSQQFIAMFLPEFERMFDEALKRPDPKKTATSGSKPG